MITRTRSRPAVDQLATSKEAFNALKAITGYKPANPAFEMSALQRAYDDMIAAEAAETQAKAAFDTARDNAVQREWAFYDAILGMRQQIVAQYGANSNEVQAVGLKKKSERKRPARSTKKAE
ncbi:MAG: hypothetical protein SFU91_06275 [Chloroherpetonaceae bacterium]|nr:hypothetical protein [Chloroherpetonaceae bacterium]